MFFSCKFTLRMFQHSIRNFCLKIVRNDGKSVRKLNIWNKTTEILRSEFSYWLCIYGCTVIKSLVTDFFVVRFSSPLDHLCGSHEGTRCWDGSKLWQAAGLVGDCSTWAYWRYATHKIRNPQDSSKSNTCFIMYFSMSLFNSHLDVSAEERCMVG